MKKRIGAMLIIATLLGLSTSVQADTLVLKNGSRVSGQIMDAQTEPIVLKIPNGKISYSHSEVAEIILDGAEFQAEAIAGNTAAFNAALTNMPVASGKPLSKEDTARVLWYLDELDEVNKEEQARCEDTGLGEERKKLVTGLGGIGPGAAPLIESALQKGNLENAPYYLAGLMSASPSRGAQVATQAVDTHGSGSMREMAVNLLAQKDPKAHVATFTRAARDAQGSVRLAALNGLRDAANSAAVPALAAALDDSVRQNRQTALLGMGELAGKSFKTSEEARAWYRDEYRPGK